MSGLAEAKQMLDNTFTVADTLAKFAAGAFTNANVDSLFTAQSIDGAKLVNGDVGETQLSSTAWAAGLEGGNGTTVGIDLDGSNGAVALVSGADWSFPQAGLKVGALNDSFTGTQVPNADWVLDLFAVGVQWKYPVLVDEQLDSTTDDVRQAIPFWMDNQPVSGDFVTLTDGSTTRTYSFGAGGDVTVTIGASLSDSMTNLAAAITGDGTGVWDAVNASGLTNLAADVVVIYRQDQTAASFDDRIFGTITTAADAHIVNLNGENSYTKTTSQQLAAVDPAQKEFGPGTETASLIAGEAHVSLNTDAQFVWDNGGGAWIQISGTGSVIGGAGIVKSGNTLAIELSANSGLQFNGVGDAGTLELDASQLLQAAARELDGDKVDIDTTFSNITPNTSQGTVDDNAQLGAILAGIDDALATAGGKPTGDDKNITSAVASGAAQDTGVDITATPLADGYVGVHVNGIGPYLLAQTAGAKATSAFYFSADAGSTARDLADIVAGDSLYVNTAVLGFTLAATDKFDLYYNV